MPRVLPPTVATTSTFIRIGWFHVRRSNRSVSSDAARQVPCRAAYDEAKAEAQRGHTVKRSQSLSARTASRRTGRAQQRCYPTAHGARLVPLTEPSTSPSRRDFPVQSCSALRSGTCSPWTCTLTCGNAPGTPSDTGAPLPRATNVNTFPRPHADRPGSVQRRPPRAPSGPSTSWSNPARVRSLSASARVAPQRHGAREPLITGKCRSRRLRSYTTACTAPRYTPAECRASSRVPAPMLRRPGTDLVRTPAVTMAGRRPVGGGLFTDTGPLALMLVAADVEPASWARARVPQRAVGVRAAPPALPP